jgi:general secretion pathway protein A
MYERFFGLYDAPFRLTPDPSYLFLSRKHADALAHLRLGLRESSGFVCITGDVGTGKTTLLRAFLGGLAPDVSTAYIFNPALSALELLQTINTEFGLPAASTSRKELTSSLNQHLLAQREAGRQAVVVIDEAQALGIEVLEQLRLLSNLETTTEKLLRIVLVGQPQLRALLLHPELVQLNQRITLRWHIGPLSAAETAAYVHHRLAVASRQESGRIFSRMALRRIHRVSGGVPRLINMICHRAMLAAFVAERRLVTLRFVRQACREIETVPLPRGATSAWRTAWPALGVGLCLGVIVASASALLFGSADPAPAPAPAVAPVDQVASVLEPPPAAPEMPAADPPAPPVAAAPAAEAADAEAKVELPTAEVNAEPIIAEPKPAPPGIEARLATVDGTTSARAALDAIFAAWGVRPLDPGEPARPMDFEAAARRRGLEHLGLACNTGMLRLLDLPAIIELQIAGASWPRYAALVSMSGAQTVLAVDGQRGAIDPSFLDRAWFGRARVFWRDFDGLGPATLGADARGEQVRRLQTLLRRSGAYHGPDTGVYDPATAAAVLDFQRSRFLLADGRVGPLTRIVLYGAAGGHPRPTLAAGGTS